MDVTLGPADLAELEFRPFKVGERYVLVSRTASGLSAIDDMCNHAGCLLSGGFLEGAAIVCPCHEYTFDLATGANVTVPKLCDDQTRFPLKVVDGALVVTLPDDAPGRS